MKKLKLLLFSLCLFSQFSFAQAGQPVPPRRIEALKVAYATRQLNLSPEDAEKFWPVYHAYVADLRKVRQEKKGGDLLDMEESVLNLRKKYRTEFRRVLTTDDRATRALTLDRDFNNMIRKELQQRAEAKKSQK